MNSQMKKRQLGSTGINLSAIGFGAAPIGDLTNIAARLKYEERIQMVLEEKSVVMTTSGGE